jgi:cellulose synthase/poly-beta-1,6-N-acetylglucosamine synthase-like glycosyltransferase
MSSPEFQASSFFAGLFDFKFTTFITLRFLRVIYTILVVLILLGGLVTFIAFASRGGSGIVVGIILAPIVTLLYLVFVRIYMELIALFFRIGENTSIMAGRSGDGAQAAGGGYGYSPPPTQ